MDKSFGKFNSNQSFFGGSLNRFIIFMNILIFSCLRKSFHSFLLNLQSLQMFNMLTLNEIRTLRAIDSVVIFMTIFLNFFLPQGLKNNFLVPDFLLPKFEFLKFIPCYRFFG